MATEVRGKFVLGLQPFDRMPNDWLRMVARVFTAYRSTPLEESIVSYINGFDLTRLEGGGPGDTTIKVGISPGQAFVDDQFIGFSQTSSLTVNSSWLNLNQEYCVTLHYEWINSMEPQEPHFLLMAKTTVSGSQHDLCLGYVVKTLNASNEEIIKVIDKKVPWYKETIDMMVGDPEKDDESKLPYLLKLNDAGPNGDREGTFDIGWALDFHTTLGNHIDYNSRLHTLENNPGELFLNDGRVITELNPDGVYPASSFDPADPTIKINNNITVVDSNTHTNSDSGIVGYGLSVINDDLLIEDVFGSITLNADQKTLNILHKIDGGSPINEVILTEVQDNVTINGYNIWHEGNLESSGFMFYYFGEVIGNNDDFPTTRIDGSDLQPGDALFSIDYQSYYFRRNDDWAKIGRTDASKQYEFTAYEGQTSVRCVYDPNFIIVTVSGTTLSKSDFVANDGHDVIFNVSLTENDKVTISTILSAPDSGNTIVSLADVNLMDLNVNDILVYKEVGGLGNYQWTNSPTSTERLQSIGDVANGTLSNGDVLIYDETNAKWDPSPQPRYNLGELKNVYIDDLQIGDTIRFQNKIDSGGNSTGDVWMNVRPEIPTGTITIWTDNEIPEGYLECDGSLLNRETFKNIFDVIGTRYGSGDGSTTFNLPDLRGEFIRGWDHGRGLDPLRELGTNQTDTMREITGTISKASTSMSLFNEDSSEQVYASGAFEVTTGEFIPTTSNAATETGITGSFGINLSNIMPTSNEIRPKNTALMYIIRY